MRLGRGFCLYKSLIIKYKKNVTPNVTPNVTFSSNLFFRPHDTFRIVTIVTDVVTKAAKTAPGFPPDPDAFPAARISPHPFPETQKNHEKTAEVFLKAFFALK
jgi:hypothetical protein